MPEGVKLVVTVLDRLSKQPHVLGLRTGAKLTAASDVSGSPPSSVETWFRVLSNASTRTSTLVWSFRSSWVKKPLYSGEASLDSASFQMTQVLHTWSRGACAVSTWQWLPGDKPIQPQCRSTGEATPTNWAHVGTYLFLIGHCRQRLSAIGRSSIGK